MALPASSALPPGFHGFGDEVFGEHAPSRVEEPWRSARSLSGLRAGDRVVVGRQAFDVLRAFDDYTVMVQKPGAKRKAFNVWQNGPTVEVREQKGSPETTLAGPVVLSAPYDQVRIERKGEVNRARPRRLGHGCAKRFRGPNRTGSGSDVFGRNEIVVQFDDGPEFARAIASGDMDDVTDEKIADVRLSPGPYAQAFTKASPKMLPDEKDGPIILALEAAPLPLGYISNALLYSKIHGLPARTRTRLYRLVKGGHVRVVKTWRPAPQYWLMAK